MKMTLSEITTYAAEFLRKSYNMELAIPVEINGRLTKSLGRFRYYATRHEASAIQISKKYLIHGNLDDIKSTIRHECIHYALYEKRRPHEDGHPVFEAELRKHNAHSTGTTELKLERNVHAYKCNCAEHTTIRPLSSNGRHHSCKSCKARLTYVGRKVALV